MKSLCLFFLLLLTTTITALSASPQAPFNLRSCDKVKPAGTQQAPFFGWYVNDPDDNEVQIAYQVIVASSQQLLAKGKSDVWDSGRVRSGQQNYVDYAGKMLAPATRYYWRVRTWDKDGNVSPYSEVTYFDTGLFGTEDWQGAVWIKRDSEDINDYTYFRKTVLVGEKAVKRAIVYLSGVHSYELFLNGSFIGKGSSHHYPQYAYYNAYDVTGSLMPSTTIATMTHWYGGGQGRAKAERGLLMKLVVEYTDGTKATFGTDRTWKQIAVPAFVAEPKRRNGEGIGFIDVIDSRKVISDWNKPGYNDHSWLPATELGVHPAGSFTGELRTDLTRLKEKEIKPSSVKSLGNGSYLIDLGKVYAGMPEISFHGGRSGDTVNMRGGFVLKEDGTVSEKMNQSTDLTYFFILNGGKAIFKPSVYLGYRYLQVNKSPTVLNTENVKFITRFYELEPERSRFSSSDTMLNQVWALMTHSLTLGAQEGFVDTPTREKGEFLGDAWSQGVPAMSTMGERALSHRILLQFLDSQDQYWPDGRLNAVYPNSDGKRDIPDYTQQYLLWVWDYYMQTGNREFLITNYEKLKKVATYVDTYKNSSTGLIHELAGGSGPYKYGIIDWPATMRYGYDMNTEARTVINAYAYADFKIMSQVAEVAGKTDDANAFKQKAARLKDAFNKLLVNSNGIYIDGLLPGGAQSKHVSQHANMFPLALGMVPEANHEVVTEAVKQRQMNVGMVTVRLLPQALGEAQEGEHLYELYTNPKWDGWAQTISRGGTATWESWDAPEHNHSLSHPWGAAGLIGIQQYILGVKPLKPQHELIQVKPLDFGGKLLNVSGVLPTDKGDIKVEWMRDSKVFRLILEIPDNVRAEVHIPKYRSATDKVEVDGRSVLAKLMGEFLLVEDVGSGRHVFELEL